MNQTASEFWTDARREALRKGVAAGAAFSDIARDLGCSRNQAAGEALRLGFEAGKRAPAPMTARGQRITERRVRAERKAPADHRARAVKAWTAALTAAPPPRPTPAPAPKPKPVKAKRPEVPVLTSTEIRSRVGVVPGSLPKPWTSRARGECAWPVEGQGADVRSCCGPVAPGRRYCQPHFEVMYQKPPKVPYVQRPRGGAERQFRA